MGKDLILDRQGSPRNDVLHIMASLYLAEVWSKETLCTSLSSDGTCLYLWFARKISILRLTEAQLIITDNICPQQV